MSIKIENARELLGDFLHGMSDKEIEDFISQCERFVNIILDYAEEESK